MAVGGVVFVLFLSLVGWLGGFIGEVCSVADLSGDSDESWRRAPTVTESGEVRLKAAARAARELRVRDRNLGLVQEHNARLHTLDEIGGQDGGGLC